MIGEEAELPLKSQIIERLSPLESSVLLLRTPWKFTSFSLSFSFSKEKRKKSFPSKCSFLEFQESFHKFFWWQGFAFTCFLSSTVGLLIVLLLLLPLVVLAPYEKVFFMLFSKKRGGVLSCNFFSTLILCYLMARDTLFKDLSLKKSEKKKCQNF